MVADHATFSNRQKTDGATTDTAPQRRRKGRGERGSMGVRERKRERARQERERDIVKNGSERGFVGP